MEAIRDEEERYEPGSELVFRCVDIGKFVEIGQSPNLPPLRLPRGKSLCLQI